MKTTTRKYLKGGEVFASGGFGCVFNPAIKCKGKKRAQNKISKLMLKKYALKEYNKIKQIKTKLEHIPKYTNYFLLNNINICKPSKLTNNDLKNYTKKCNILSKNNITKQNINNSLDNLISLNMPNGGIALDDYYYDNIKFNNLLELNNTLIALLINGILKMNEQNIYHCDIKDSNVLVKINNNKIYTRLIDWGLTTEYIPFKNNPFPQTWRNRPFQFNVPFSVIIFTDYFVEKYTKYINDGNNIDYNNLKPFVIDYIYSWLKKRGQGHYKFINTMMKILFYDVNEDLIEDDITIPYISNYIIEILINFTKFKEDGSLNLRYYLDNIFIKIVDIWGFITTYFSILEILHKNNKTHTELFIFIKSIFIKYLYLPRIEPIDINELKNDLNHISYLFENDTNINTISLNNISTNVTHKTTIKTSKNLNTKTYNNNFKVKTKKITHI
jgi:hypothetical protein